MTKPFAILIFALSFLTLQTESTMSNISHYCSNSRTFAPKSTYQANLKMLKSLNSRAEVSDGFFNAGKGKPSDDDARGCAYMFCWDGVSDDVCRDCITDGIATIEEICPTAKVSSVLLPNCFVMFETCQLDIDLWKAEKKKRFLSRLRVAIPSATSAVALLCIVLCFTLKRERNKRNRDEEDPTVGSEISQLDSLQFDVRTIEAATAYFSNHSKLGEGGFGPVYGGTLPCGRKIAAKRLSQNSKQGVQEFENEVILVAKLQHRNIVRLVGFSMERGETIIVYEYLPNGSLDQLLFDPQQGRRLDWLARHKIMVGVGHGLLYLHKDSQLQIIHRDLKASNILLDDDMTPKISDFGMARSLGAEQTQRSTKRIAGTHGYMSPEYVMYGQFSVKSDVFSFGVLMLEIITGKKNRYSYVANHNVGLLYYVWEHWTSGTPLETVDPTMGETYSTNEVIRCIHIGLLCVQNDKESRPDMDAIVFMLSSTDSVSLTVPEQPAFIIPKMKHEQQFQDQNSNQSNEKLNSSKKISQCSVISSYVTDVAPR